MIKVYQKYLVTSFLKTLLVVFSIFLSLVIILNIFEEVSYLRDTDTNLLFPIFLTFLNSPSIVYETFPFIFFISTQFLFIRLMDKEELDIFKKILHLERPGIISHWKLPTPCFRRAHLRKHFVPS